MNSASYHPYTISSSADWGPNTVFTAAHWWAEQVAFGLVAESSWGSERVMRIRFEDLINETEMTLRRICAYLDIDYQPEMTKGSGFRLPEYTSEQHQLIGKTPDIRRIDAWEKELSDRQIEIFENLTNELLLYFGYKPKFGIYAREITDWERVATVTKELYEYIFNRFRLRLRTRQIKK